MTVWVTFLGELLRWRRSSRRNGTTADKVIKFNIFCSLRYNCEVDEDGDTSGMYFSHKIGSLVDLYIILPIKLSGRLWRRYICSIGDDEQWHPRRSFRPRVFKHCSYVSPFVV